MLERIDHLLPVSVPSIQAASNFSRKPVKQHYLGLMNYKCKYCKALHWKTETKGRQGTYSSCCSFGQVPYTRPRKHPPLIRQLLEETHVYSDNFKEYTRSINNAHAMISFGANTVQFQMGPPVYIIHGQTYHVIGPAEPNEPEHMAGGALYFIDARTALTQRMGRSSNENCDRNLMFLIDDMLRSINPYVRSYLKMKEVVQQEQRQAVIENRPMLTSHCLSK